MYIRVSLRGMLRLIRIDTLRRVNHVGFIPGRLIYCLHRFHKIGSNSQRLYIALSSLTFNVSKRLPIHQSNLSVLHFRYKPLQTRELQHGYTEQGCRLHVE